MMEVTPGILLEHITRIYPQVEEMNAQRSMSAVGQA